MITDIYIFTTKRCQYVSKKYR